MSAENPIYHISDIHIREGFYEDILYAFRQLIDQIKRNRRSILVIAGDIFERKTRLDPYDIQCFNKILDMLKQYNIITVIIPGNHDFNTNKGGLDLITPLLQNNKDTYPNIHCYPESGVYRHNNIDFHVLSPIDRKIPDIDMENKSSNTKVAIAHETVKGATFDSNVTVQTARLTVEKLKDYDFVLLGDIHKPQFLTPHIAYCGSLIQKHRGEGLSHGYIKWNPKTKTGEFHSMPLRRAFITITTHNNKMPELPDENPREIRLEHQVCDQSFVEDLIKKIEEKYNKQISHVADLTPSPVHTSNEKTSTIGGVEVDNSNVNLETVENQLIVLDAYLKGLGQDEETIEKIKAMHIQKTRDFRITRKRWKLNYLYWDTAYCYGPNNFIDFRKTKGVIPVLGKNMAGKSAILDILLLALFNKGMRGDMGEIPNKYAKTYRVVVSFTVAGDEYVAERFRIGARHSKFILTKNGDNITSSTSTETLKKVEELIGTEKEFKGVVACTQDVELIAAKKGATRINRFHQYLGTAELTTVAKQCGKEIKSLETTIKKLDEINMKIGKTAEKLMTSIKEETEVELNKNSELRTMEKQLKELRQDRDKLLLDMPKVNKNFRARYVEIQKALGRTGDLKIDSNVAQKEIDAAQKELQTATAEKDQLQDMILALQDQLESCPNVEDDGSPLDIPDNMSSADLEMEIKKLEQKVKHKSRRKTTYDEQTLKEKTTSRPSGDVNQLLRKIQPCSITKEQMIPDELKKFVKDLPNLEQHKKKYLKLQTRLVLVDRDLLDKLKRDKSKIQTKYKTITFNQTCECCQKNKTTITTINGEYAMREQIERLERQIATNKKIQDTIKKYEARINGLEAVKKIIDNNQVFQQNHELEQRIKRLKEYEACVHDLAQIKNEEILTSLKKYRHALSIMKVREVSETNKSVNADIAQYTIKRDKLSRTISSALEKTRIYRLLKERDDIKRYSNLNKKSKVISEKIQNIEETRKQVYEERATASAAISKYEEQMKMRKANDKEISDKTEKVRILTLYSKQCLDSRKGIPFQIMKYALKRIQQNMNEILFETTDFQVRFEFEEDGKTIKLNMKIVERPRHSSVLIEPMAISSQMASGFQKFILELAFRLAIIEAIPYFPRFLMIDEGFGKFDRENLEKVKITMMNLFNVKKYNLQFIMIISHLEELQTINENTIRIKKRRFPDNKDIAGSYVRYGTIPDSFPTMQYRQFIKESKTIDKKPKKQIKSRPTNDPNSFVQRLTETQRSQLTAYEEEQITIEDKKFTCGVCRKELIYRAGSVKKHCASKTHMNSLLTKAKKSGVVPRKL